MLKGMNDQALIQAGWRAEQVLFCQTWKELAEGRTFDQYQYKSFDLLNGIDELIHNINAYLEGAAYTPHFLDAVREELLDVLRRDTVAAERFPALRNRLLQSLGKRSEKPSQLKALRYQLECCRRTLERDYDTAMVKRLAQAVDTQTAEQRDLTSQFISRCVDLGWSVKALSGKIDTLRNEMDRGGSTEGFLAKILNARKQTYAIFLPFRLKIVPKEGNTKEEARTAVICQLRSFEIDVKGKAEIAAEFPGIDGDQLRDTQAYIIVKTEAHDIFSAAHFAVITLSRVLNILSFFTTIESWTVNDLTFVAFNLDAPYTRSQKASDIYKTYEYLDSSSRVYSRTARFISRNGYYHPISQKLLSSFSYANLSRSSMALEEKYMNIWIALESLCRTDTCETIIEGILTLVPNALCLRYPYRLVRNFVEDCVRCGLSFDFPEKVLDPKAANKEALVRETIALFRDDTLRAQLEQKCLCNALLHQRFHELSLFLTDPQVFARWIREYHTTAIRHLNRLYRVRNEIAHSGSLQEISTIRYTEHLYDYLATLVSEIMRFSEARHLDSLGELFAVINDNYAEFLDLSAAKKPLDQSAALGTLWDTGIMDYL